MTRAQLKELKLALDKQNFTESNLNQAISTVKNEEIVAEGIDTKFLSSELAGGFVGCTFGPYAVTTDEADAPRVHFKDWYIEY